jgi:DNA-directed RNA polymerase subunit RPC12/RpoP
MVQIMWPRKPLRKFEMTRGSDKKEYLFVAALALVIVVALALTIYFTFLGGGTRKVAAGEFMYQCSKCGNEFSIDQQTRWRLEESDKPLADCPKCGAKQSAYRMVKCPNPACGKYYVLETTKNPAKVSADDNCPYCKTNYGMGLHGTFGPAPR